MVYLSDRLNRVRERIRELEYRAEKISQNIYKGTI